MKAAAISTSLNIHCRTGLLFGLAVQGLLAVFLGLCGGGGVLQAQTFDPDKLSSEDRAKAKELLTEYRENTADPEKQIKALKKMMDLGRGVAVKMKPMIEREWRATMPPYRAEFQKRAASFTTRKIERNRAEIEAHRSTLASLRAKGGALSKADTKGRGRKAMDALKKLFFSSTKEILAASPALAELRAAAVTASTKKQILLERLVEDGDEAETDLLKRFEEHLVTDNSPISPDAKKILAMNRKVAAEAGVPSSEVEGIRELNMMRILAGLNPLALDPRLCTAARDHSRDMEEKKFFSHTSTVPGKRKFTTRAALAGTSASAENIAAGQSSAHGANMAWFYSPGHHINMFGGHRRVGLGRFKRKWTQMFGR